MLYQIYGAMKKIGGYLAGAGLITGQQIEAALAR